MIQQTSNGIRVTVFAQPNASRNEVIGPYNDAIKIKITAPPIDGRANKALIEFFSELFKIPKKDITLFRGDLSKNKIFQIDGISIETARVIFKI